jgi:hypothetical protein
MIARTRRPVRRGDKHEFLFRRLLLGRGRRLTQSDFGSGDVNGLLLRVCRLLEGVVMGTNLVLISRTSRRFLGGRSEASINDKTGQPNQNKTTRCAKENLRCVNPELRKDLLLCSRRRAAAQRRGGDRTVAVITRSEMGVIRVFRIFDNVRNSLSLRGPRWRRSSGGRSFQHFSKIAPRIFAHLWLGRIASGYVDHLHKDKDRTRH